MKVVIVSDRPVIADAIHTELAGSLPDVKIRHASPSGRLAGTDAMSGDVVIIDSDSIRDRVRLCRELDFLSVHVIVVIDGPKEALHLLQAGAAGVVTTEQALHGLVEAVNAVLGGHTHVPSPMVADLLQNLIAFKRDTVQRRGSLDRLSAREREVLCLLGDGYDQRGIAHRMAISPETAKTHIRNVRNKLGLRSRIEAAALASELGLSGMGSDQ